MSDSEGCKGDPIDPHTACLACGSQDNPESMVICDSCSQGFHLSCFGLPTIPEDDEWQCQGCLELQRLQLLVLEMPQPLYSDEQDPHFTQGLFKATITSAGRVLPGMLRQVQLQVEDAPLPGSISFYSNSTFKRLQRIPTASRLLAEKLYQRTGSELCTVTVTSGRFCMFGSCAAAANKAAEAWVAGPDAVQQALQTLDGPAKQLYLLSNSGSSSNNSKEGHRRVSTVASKAAAAQAEQDTGDQQQQQPVPMQTPSPPQQQQQQQQHSGQQQHIQHPTGLSAEPTMPPNQPVPPPAAPAYMTWPQMGPGAEPHQMPNLTAYPTAPWPYMAPPAQPYGVPNYPAAHPAGPHPGQYAPAVPVPVIMVPWGWPAAAAPGWGGIPGPYNFAPPPLPPGWQPALLGGQQAQALQGGEVPRAPAAAVGGGKASQRCKQVSKRARQQVFVEAAARVDEDEEAGCTSDEDCPSMCQLLLDYNRLSKWYTR